MKKIITEEIVEIDLDSFKAYCHFFGYGGNATKSRCGKIPRIEQPEHGQIVHDGTIIIEKYCFGCGLEICYQCKALIAKS